MSRPELASPLGLLGEGGKQEPREEAKGEPAGGLALGTRLVSVERGRGGAASLLPPDLSTLQVLELPGRWVAGQA